MKWQYPSGVEKQRAKKKQLENEARGRQIIEDCGWIVCPSTGGPKANNKVLAEPSSEQLDEQSETQSVTVTSSETHSEAQTDPETLPADETEERNITNS